MNLRIFILSIGLAACGGGDDGGGSSVISTPRCVDTVDLAWTYNYSVGVVSIRANELTIDSNGQLHTPPTTTGQYELGTDPPNGTLPDRTTLELLWMEGADTIKLNAYFETDGTDWWASEMKHKDAQIINGDDWVEYMRELFRCPVGQAYVGDVKLDADAGAPASMTFEDLYVKAF